MKSSGYFLLLIAMRALFCRCRKGVFQQTVRYPEIQLPFGNGIKCSASIQSDGGAKAGIHIDEG
jgi:hypothetical protein